MLIYKAILRHRARKWQNAPGADIPTVCVGNVTVGGTGKTPHVELILRLLGAGDKIAVLSRGYKRKSKGFQYVETDSGAAFAGDEPLQIKRKFPGVVVAVDKDRVEGCERLAAETPGQAGSDGRHCRPDRQSPGIIVLDDAFQYNRLHASLNIVLVDYNRPVWKDCLLPFGRLRDLPERLADADIVIITKCPGNLGREERESISAKARKYLPEGSQKELPVLFTRIAYDTPRPVYAEGKARPLEGKEFVLFTGIAGDGPLVEHLAESGRVVEHLRFPDHHAYTPGDIARIAEAARRHPEAIVATTEKDAQRIRDCRDLPAGLRERLVEFPIRAEFLLDEDLHLFESKLFNLIKL